MGRPTSTWKAVERAAARFFGIERVWGEMDDCRGHGLSLEVKHGKQIPKWLLRTWQQCLDNLPDEDHVPIVVLHPSRWRYRDMLVVMEMSEVLRLLKLERDIEGVIDDANEPEN